MAVLRSFGVQRIGLVVYDGFQSMSFAGLSVFETANMMAGKPLYEMHYLSEKGGPVRSSTGMVIHSDPFDNRVFDTVMVGGGTSILQHAPPGVLAFMRRSAKKARRVASICTGSFILAEAGILDGKRAKTHWLPSPHPPGRH